MSATRAGNAPLASWRGLVLTQTSSGSARGKRSCQRGAVAAGRGEHPVAERADQAGVLGDRDELDRVEEPAVGVLPAHERLDGGDGAALQLDDRLVDDAQLALLDPAPQLVLGPQPREHALAEHVVEQLVAAAAALLRAVHGGVGVAQEVGRVGVGGLGDRDPDAGGDEVLARREHDRLVDRLRDALGNADRLVRAVELLAHDEELVAAEARDGVGRPDGIVQPRGERDQQVVARLVAIESLTSLNWSRSASRTATARPSRRRRASAPSSRSSASARFGSPVSGSCIARWRTSSSTRLRSTALEITLATARRKSASSGVKPRGTRACAPSTPQLPSRAAIATVMPTRAPASAARRGTRTAPRSRCRR